MKNQKGFTLIELVMVIVILGILSAVAIPKYVNMQKEAKIAAAKGVIGSVRSAIAIKYAENALTHTASTPVPFPTLAELTATNSTSIFAERKMPESPVNNFNTVTASTTDPIAVATECNDSTGYLYNSSTGEIRYNSTEADGNGKNWNTY